VGDVLFSVWETRVQDYEAFTRATGHTYEAPSFTQSPTHPVVNVSWNDAMAFCQWLTEKEREEGLLEEGQTYRLPTDEEWSRAAGLEKEGEGLPQDLDKKVKGAFPWGKDWPPPKTAGNYAFGDEYPQTSPSGSFAPNARGIYDLGGNVWEWCMDWYNSEHLCRVLRGASWYNGDPDDPDLLLSSCRVDRFPERRKDTNGFRCILAFKALPESRK
jgi:formylglycine-generating enzyme required for sulfatase activity